MKVTIMIEPDERTPLMERQQLSFQCDDLDGDFVSDDWLRNGPSLTTDLGAFSALDCRDHYQMRFKWFRDMTLHRGSAVPATNP